MSRWDWLGLTEKRWHKEPDEELRPAKTAWDWLQMAVVPVVLVVIALAFNASQSARDRERDLQARQDATLETYLGRMSDLMLERKLLSSEENADVRAVARTMTLTTLRRLDGDRKLEVFEFLSEAHLIDNTPTLPPK